MPVDKTYTVPFMGIYVLIEKTEKLKEAYEIDRKAKKKWLDDNGCEYSELSDPRGFAIEIGELEKGEGGVEGFFKPHPAAIKAHEECGVTEIKTES